MRVAYVCADTGVPAFGSKGCSVHVQEVIRAMRARGADVELFASRLGGTAPAGLEDLTVHELPGRTGGTAKEREQAALRANDELGTALATAGAFDLVYERQSLWSFAAMAHAAASGIPGLLEINAPLIDEQARHRSLIHRVEAETIVARSQAAASALLTVSDELAHGLRLDPSLQGRVHVVGNGVDPDRFTPAPARRDQPLTIGFVGTLKPWHDVATLVDAFDELRSFAPDARLAIVGDGPERDPLERRVEARGCADATTFVGAVAPSDVPDRLMEIDIAVAPYAAMEDFYFAPLKIYEYMAAGRAIVASRVGAVERTLVHEDTALLCEPGSTTSLAAALRRLCADDALRQRLGTSARTTALSQHTWNSVVERILRIAASSTPPSRVGSTRP
ncbi:MAG: glycosyltransferase family 4 protein [Planctomycetota bacterium]